MVRIATAPRSDPLERILAIARVRRIHLVGLRYVRATESQPGEVRLHVRGTSDRWITYLTRAIGVVAVEVLRGGTDLSFRCESSKYRRGGTSATAALIIDMQNGFLDPAGSLSLSGQHLDGADELLTETKGLVDGVRALGWPVIYTRHQYRPDFVDCPPKVRARWPSSVRPLIAGSWDAAVHASLSPLPEDLVIEKNRYDAFLHTDLEVILRGLAVSRLVVAGVVTNVCVESTVRSAAQRDFEVYVAADCTAAVSDFKGPSLRAMAETFATVGPWRQLVVDSPGLGRAKADDDEGLDRSDS